MHLIPKTLFVLFLGGLEVMDAGQLFIDDDVSLVAHFLPFRYLSSGEVEGSVDNKCRLFIFFWFLV